MPEKPIPQIQHLSMTLIHLLIRKIGERRIFAFQRANTMIFRKWSAIGHYHRKEQMVPLIGVVGRHETVVRIRRVIHVCQATDKSQESLLRGCWDWRRHKA